VQRSIYIDLEPGQSVGVNGGKVRMTLEQKSGRRARLKVVFDDSQSIEAPRAVAGAAALAAKGLSGM
jgi:hypothetical protein